jgi:hypothetical protein
VVALGAGEILLTSMDRDGTRQGFDLPLTQAIADSVPVPVIASGGVGNLDHLVDGIRQGHATAVLAASIFHFGEFTIRQAKDHMVRAGLPMRLDPSRERGQEKWKPVFRKDHAQMEWLRTPCHKNAKSPPKGWHPCGAAVHA